MSGGGVTAGMEERYMSKAGAAQGTETASALAGKFMTFKLGSEAYGLQILKVRELIGLMDITRVPSAPPCVRGVINLRGKVIPVVDLRQKFAMGATGSTDQTVIIVVQIALGNGPLTMGVLVDEVMEVLDIDAAHIEPPPDFGAASTSSRFILGVGKADKRVIFLLDIDLVLSADESSAAHAAAA
jgi:purine-binding chemotaxis protein CheW